MSSPAASARSATAAAATAATAAAATAGTSAAATAGTAAAATAATAAAATSGASAAVATGGAASSEAPGARDTIASAEVDALEMSPLDRWKRALRALATVVDDPAQTDQVLVFSIYANAGTIARRIGRFYAHPEAQRLYDERRMIDSRTIDLDALAALPDGTLGHAYATFLRSRGLTPAVFDAAPREVRDPRIAYVVQRLRQTHDLWHVVTGQDTDPASEIALQAFTFAQMLAPSSFILAVAGTLRGIGAPRSRLAREAMAAFWIGRRAEKLAAFPWEDHWATPLATVRAMLGLPSYSAAPAAPPAPSARAHAAARAGSLAQAVEPRQARTR